MSEIEKAVSKCRRYLEAVNKGLNGVTEGPWEWNYAGDSELVQTVEDEPVCVVDQKELQFTQRRNAIFISYSRTWVPELAKAVEKAVEEWEAGRRIESENERAYGYDSGQNAMIIAMASALPETEGAANK